jgi:crotonobetainyl-CoA:carnitine CoA-transferase CaiB-like acyl-CoA transferase
MGGQERNLSMGALSHLRVLDLSRVLAAPWATQIMGDLGADIIKIEKPGEGDETRRFGPPFLTNPDGSRGDATYFLTANRNKKSVTVDIAQPEGQVLVKRLARRSHIVVENFKTGSLAKYSLDYDSLKAENPALIYCSLTGFGHDGPYKDKAGYDYVIQGMAGLMSVTGQKDGEPGAEPMKVGVAVSDLITGLYAAIAILAAVIHQARTGEGQSIDMALFDCQVAGLANQATNYLSGGMVPGRLGNAHPNIVPYQVFATSDGHLILATSNDNQFRRFCAAAGLAGVADDSRYATNAERVARRQEVVDIIKPVLLARSTAAWIDALEAANVPCGPINRVDEVFADPQAIARGLTVAMSHSASGPLKLPASPLRLSATPPEYLSAPPLLGEHTEAVLSTVLGLDAREITRLRERGIV